MEDSIKALLQELKAALSDIYGRGLKGVYLYGSYARGEQDSESDVDVLVVLRRFDHYGAEIERTGHAVSQLSLKYGVSISRVFATERDWSAARTPFLVRTRQEAIAA